MILSRCEKRKRWTDDPCQRWWMLWKKQRRDPLQCDYIRCSGSRVVEAWPTTSDVVGHAFVTLLSSYLLTTTPSTTPWIIQGVVPEKYFGSSKVLSPPRDLDQRRHRRWPYSTPISIRLVFLFVNCRPTYLSSMKIIINHSSLGSKDVKSRPTHR